MKRGETSSGNRPERKIIEKNRRIQMKGLCFKLVSLIPDHHFIPPKEFLSQHDQLEQATNYISILRERIEELRRKKTQALMNTGATTANNMSEPNLPIMKIEDLGSSLEVVLISGLNKNFMLHQIIRVIEQEGAEVNNVSISTAGDKILHIIHAEVKVLRIGVDTSRISERIRELISGF